MNEAAITVERALRQVVQRYGRHALDDPVALRAALRDCAPELPAADVELLVAVGGSGGWQPVRRAALVGTDPGLAVPEAVRAVRGSTAVAPDDAERACRAFAAAFAPATGPRISWEPEAEAAAVTGEPFGAIPVGPAATARPRRWRAVLVAAGAVVLLAGAAVVALTGRGDEPARPDRWAVDQVAQRYRALGATLLDGALRCGPLAPAPGELEKGDCSFGGWSVVLTSYDSAFRLDRVREREVAAQPDSNREAITKGPAAAFTMRELTGNDPARDPATATVYWDAQDPRPMSATITTTELSLPALIRFWDTRRVGAGPRPAVPGAEFESAALWQVAQPFVDGAGASCGPLPATQAPYYGAVESVRCQYPNGARIDFNRLATAEQLRDNREVFASPEDTVPGSLRLGGWTSRDDGKLQGQLIEYVLTVKPGSHLYFDQPDLLVFARLYHADLTQDQLKAFWVDVGG